VKRIWPAHVCQLGEEPVHAESVLDEHKRTTTQTEPSSNDPDSVPGPRTGKPVAPLERVIFGRPGQLMVPAGQVSRVHPCKKLFPSRYPPAETAPAKWTGEKPTKTGDRRFASGKHPSRSPHQSVGSSKRAPGHPQARHQPRRGVFNVPIRAFQRDPRRLECGGLTGKSLGGLEKKSCGDVLPGTPPSSVV